MLNLFKSRLVRVTMHSNIDDLATTSLSPYCTNGSLTESFQK